MGVDKKSDHVGNHGGRYADMDGMTKQFTYVDHDRHTTRLKVFSYDRKEKQLSDIEALAEEITLSGMAEDQRFIDMYDGKLAKKYGYERYHKGKPVKYIQMSSDRGNRWYYDLRKLYRKLQAEPIQQSTLDMDQTTE